MGEIVLPDLYPHQEDLRDRTRTALGKLQRVILCAQTGMGKTRTAKWILGATANRTPRENQSGRSLFTVHRRGLVDNASQSFSEEPALPHGVIMSGRETHYGRRVQVASIDTLLNWFVESGEYPSDITFDLIIWDEAHSHHSKFARFLKYHDAKREALGQPPAYVIGLTATPQAAGLADVYREIVLGPSTEWLIANKFLAPFRYFRATQGKLGLLVKKGDEFTKESAALAMDGLAGDLVRDWKKYADGRPTLGFFTRRSQAQDALLKLTEAGLRVEYVDGETADDERIRIFRALNEHRIDYLCNVQVVERGTDIPRIGCVQLCVAIGSLPRYRQCVGRGARVHPEKTDCCILDHGGNVQRHGFFEDDPQWTLDIRAKDPGEQGTRPTIECPCCQAIYRGGKCRSCGYEPTPKERRGQGLEFDGSELREAKREEKTEKPARSAEDLLISALYMSGKSGRTWKQCCGIFRGLCEKQNTPTMRVPASFIVGGHRYRVPRYGSDDAARKVCAIFPFTLGARHGGKYEVSDTQTEVQW